jgi:hypothetical protein
MTERFHRVFQRDDNSAARAKFLSRIFGVFSDEIVKLWTENSKAPYKNLGRPTLRKRGLDQTKHTIDFTLSDRNEAVFVAEMKCEIQYQNFKYFVLQSDAERRRSLLFGSVDDQLEHHVKPAFEAFLQAARSPNDWRVFVKKREIPIQGAILIWGAATEDGKAQVKERRGFHDVLTIAEICRDLRKWNCEKFKGLVTDRRQWCNEMFDGLLDAGD